MNDQKKIGNDQGKRMDGPDFLNKIIIFIENSVIKRSVFF